MRSRTMMIVTLLMAVLSPASDAPSTIGLRSRLDTILQRYFQAGDFNGNVLVGWREKMVYERSFGLANREWGVPNDAHTRFEIGSMTKQFTALLVLQFVSEGKVLLDGRITDYLPYYRRETGERISIHHLLTHTSGIPDFIRSGEGFIDGPESRRRYQVREFVVGHCSGNLEFEPGSKFSYSNSGYFLLGAILEEVSKKTYEQLLIERIFQPLGMKESGYTHTDTILRNRAAGYERTTAGLQNARYYDMSIPFSAGALYSTTSDLFLWDRALYTERLLPARLRDLLFTPNLEGYGYGWSILVPESGSPYAGEQIPMHGGAIFGFQSLIQRIPKHQELIVLLENSDSPKLLEIALEIRRTLATSP